tara:strand:+ start:225 stop:440 length:216 start_codon:yes stop_codon:yes gene_type:complete
MIHLRDDILKNADTYYKGLIAKHKQNVEVYLTYPVGIGEHTNIMESIDKELDAIGDAHEKLEIINHYFKGR